MEGRNFNSLFYEVFDFQGPHQKAKGGRRKEENLSDCFMKFPTFKVRPESEGRRNKAEIPCECFMKFPTS